MIYYFKCYDKKGLWYGYRNAMNLLKSEDWAVLMDGDTMFLGVRWGEQIEYAITHYSDAGLITGVSNRSGYHWAQGYQGKFHEISDVKHWRKVALELEKKYFGQCTLINQKVTGLLMIIKKQIWDAHIEQTGVDLEGNLGLDDHICERLLMHGQKIYRLEGLFVFHYYRLLEGSGYREHLLT